ncbi:hypothetical protein FRC03_004655 [Tulasnella sp. 419]|nr:hypothetical protein FRC03_004655 [Tulasnella sp. 419]
MGMTLEWESKICEEVPQGQLRRTQDAAKMTSEPVDTSPKTVTDSGNAGKSDVPNETVEKWDRRRDLIDEEVRRREVEIKWREEEIERYEEESLQVVDSEAQREEASNLDMPVWRRISSTHRDEDMKQLKEDVRRLREEMDLLEEFMQSNPAEIGQQSLSLRSIVHFVPPPDNIDNSVGELNPVASPEYEAKWKLSIFPYVCIEVHNASCMICQTDFEVPPVAKGEDDDKQMMPELLRQLNCRHVFHRWCIDEHIRGSLGNCPVCRRQVDQELVGLLRSSGGVEEEDDEVDEEESDDEEEEDEEEEEEEGEWETDEELTIESDDPEAEMRMIRELEDQNSLYDEFGPPLPQVALGSRPSLSSLSEILARAAE